MDAALFRFFLFVLAAAGALLRPPREAGAQQPASAAAPAATITYRILPGPVPPASLRQEFSAEQLAILEKLNRADRDHLPRLRALVVPEIWLDDELAYSPLPESYPAASAFPKFVAVDLAGQVFGAYENGRLVRWGPVSSGVRHSPTPAGLYHLNWKARRHVSTVDPSWIMTWYFNFENQQGRALHAYAMPGYPASHSCVRLLERDAQWLYEWGEPWVLDERGWEVLRPGTPVFLIGEYNFDAPYPWRSPDWLARKIVLPEVIPGLAPAPTP